MHTFFEYSPEVKQALQNQKPILALESTLITHGLAFPHNLATAMAAEKIVREQNVTPATIAIMQGKIKIGLTQEELETLVQDKNALKASKRDIPTALSKRLNAGTTVAATLFCAHHAGIKIFATGGIGGVHRGNQQDVSADLIELAQTPMAVVCAGAKAILDLARTLEFLETFSVPIIGYRTTVLPAFYTTKTAHALPITINDIATLATFLHIHWQLKMPSGVLIMNPIPTEDEIAADMIEPVIHQALMQAEKAQIQGKAITPYLLNEIAKVTEGKSLQANISLIKNNIKLGAELAQKIHQEMSC
ncbi:MAG: pseudouridine-5'-phosphate glycosidase [Gammaproteobacteria bacterium]|nr:pseudouridine-5'-phosphate glycosidase [Gammaproteobacteria bacterium]